MPHSLGLLCRCSVEGSQFGDHQEVHLRREEKMSWHKNRLGVQDVLLPLTRPQSSSPLAITPHAPVPRALSDIKTTAHPKDVDVGPRIQHVTRALHDLGWCWKKFDCMLSNLQTNSIQHLFCSQVLTIMMNSLNRHVQQFLHTNTSRKHWLT